MVFYFKLPDGLMVYMGRDKHENEDLIRYAWPGDVWFHVDRLSSAHVYLRLAGAPFDFASIPAPHLAACAQLTKANSIEGCKKESVDVCYTPADNLSKREDMDVGQVGYHDRKRMKLLTNVAKDAALLKALNQTRTERFPDLSAELNAHRDALNAVQKQVVRERKERAQAERKEQQSAQRQFQQQVDEFNNRPSEDYDEFM